jgi:hypothetical protein
MDMKHLSIATVFLALLCPLATAPSNASNVALQDELRKLEQQWLNAAAIPDLPVLRRMFANDFMGTAFGPNV